MLRGKNAITLLKIVELAIRQIRLIRVRSIEKKTNESEYLMASTLIESRKSWVAEFNLKKNRLHALQSSLTHSVCVVKKPPSDNNNRVSCI